MIAARSQRLYSLQSMSRRKINNYFKTFPHTSLILFPFVLAKRTMFKNKGVTPDVAVVTGVGFNHPLLKGDAESHTLEEYNTSCL